MKQAAGFGEVVTASGGQAKDAMMLMLADKMEDLIRVQVEAIRNLKIDKITVWDNGQNKEGKTSTAGFLSGLMQSIPPMNELFEMTGMKIPEFLGTKLDAPQEKVVEGTVDNAPEKADVQASGSPKPPKQG